MATLPRLRDDLLAHAARLHAGPVSAGERAAIADDIVRIVGEMKRRPPVRRAQDESPPLTPALKRHVAKYAKDHPLASYRTIANHFGINHGRVSETLAGKRR